jgi:acetolactate synthase-1/2/3 large subunit
MKMTGADIVVRALEDEGIPFTFGIPGTHNIELYDSLARSTKVRPILVTDEQSASFMADGVARSSGMLAAANVVPGAGLTHALSGIAEAYLDGIAMLVLACGIRRDTGKAYQLHAVDQHGHRASRDQGAVPDRKAARIYTPPSGAPAGLRARRPPGRCSWRSPRSTTSSGMTWTWTPTKTSRTHRQPSARPTSTRPAPCWPPPPSAPVSGTGSRGRRRGSRRAGRAAGSSGGHHFHGQGHLSRESSSVAMVRIWRAAPPFVRKIAAGCDLTLAIGCRFSEVGTGSYGLEIPGKLVHVDIDPSVLDKNYRADLPIVADAAPFIAALLTNLPARKADPD